MPNVKIALINLLAIVLKNWKNLGMMKSKFKLIILSLIVFISVSGVIGVYNELDNLNNQESRQAFTVLQEPITIISDLDFEGYSSRGVGSINEPYIIENYELILSENNTFGIIVANTSKHFVIQNNLVQGAGMYGVYITNVTKGIGIVSYNEIKQCGEGIRVSYSANITIIGNLVTSNSDEGIRLKESFGIIIINNTISHNVDGIKAVEVNQTIIKENEVENNKDDGIYLYNTSTIEITKNSIKQNLGDGVKIAETQQIAIDWNNISKNHDTGIQVKNAKDSNITYNIIYKNEFLGLDFDKLSYNNKIHHNSIVDNSGTFTIQARDYGDNIWYDQETLEGNFWSHSYAINAASTITGGAEDKYRLAEPPVGDFFSYYDYYDLFMKWFIIYSVVVLSITTLFFVFTKKERKNTSFISEVYEKSIKEPVTASCSLPLLTPEIKALQKRLEEKLELSW
ncbi:MAG: right-handed parallel beta-helix repeat-containing protein, partial [Candidatus Kariarchaeaceae archaeon]